jgi:hypothetical protein
VDVSPDLKEKLFNGEINVFNCTRCAHVEPLEVPLLYHDMRREFLVWYFPLNSLGEDGFLNYFTQHGELDGNELNIPKDNLRTHFVFDMNELLRYIVFRERLYEKWEAHEGEERGNDVKEALPMTEIDAEAAAVLMEAVQHLVQAIHLKPALEETIREVLEILLKAVTALAPEPEGTA